MTSKPMMRRWRATDSNSPSVWYQPRPPGTGVPAMVRFVSQVAVRFGVPVSEKVIAQSLPVVGAAGGAILNTLFIDHFQDMARGHFIVRRLERTYGRETVRVAYLQLP